MKSKSRTILTAALCLTLALALGASATAEVVVGVGTKYANGTPRLAIIAGWESDNLAVDANVMLADPGGKVTLWEGRVSFGQIGPYLGTRATYANVPGQGLTIGPEGGIHGKISLGDWDLAARAGAAKVETFMYVWDVSARRSFGGLTIEAGVQQNRFWRIETWPRVAVMATF